MPCQVFLDLMKSSDLANKRRLTAVGDLIEFARRVEHTGFEDLKRAVKDTADTWLTAWKAMNDHRQQHCCDLPARKSTVPAASRSAGA
jgi:hypothetical protein